MHVDVAIIGGGIVGLSVAHQLAAAYPDLRLGILEKEEEVAQHQTSHNSGVIHSGIYYKPGSLRAINCQRGYKQLLTFCDQQDIPYEICGKLIVATEEKEIPALKNIYQRGQENGLQGLEMLTPEEANKIEPHIGCVAAIRVPQTGIIDFEQVSKTYKRLFEERQGNVWLNSKVFHISREEKNLVVHTRQLVIKTSLVVTCGGLYADQLARMTMPKLPYQIIPFRGEYYELKKEMEGLVNHLIYPVPNPEFPFLGVHFTRMIQGGVEAGPNAVLAFRREGYLPWQIDPGELLKTLTYPGFQRIAKKYWRTGLEEMKRSFSKKAFLKALQKLIPEIKASDISKGRSGVRATACDREGNIVDDFLILEEDKIIHVINAPSPAATASIAIGEHIVEKIQKQLAGCT